MSIAEACIPANPMEVTNKFGYFEGKAVQWLIGNRLLIGTGSTTIEAIHDLAGKLMKVFYDKFEDFRFFKTLETMKRFSSHPEDTVHICQLAHCYEMSVTLNINSRGEVMHSVKAYSDEIPNILLGVLRNEKFLHSIKLDLLACEGEEISLEIILGATKLGDYLEDMFVFKYKSSASEEPFIVNSKCTLNIVDSIANMLLEKMFVTLEGKLEDGK